MCDIPENAVLFLDSARGIYIPRDFFECVNPAAIVWDCSEETKSWILEACADPDHADYWDAWNEAEAYGRVNIQDPDSGIRYYLLHDGDLWLVPVEEK